MAALRIDLVGTTADFRCFGRQRPLPLNHLLDENRGTAGRIGEVRLDTEIARRAEIGPGQIYRWRRELGVGHGFAQVLIAPAGDDAGCPAAPAIEIEFAGKARLRIPASIPAGLAAAVVKALLGR